MMLRLQVSPYVPQGQILVMSDYSHPETPMFEFSFGENGIESRPAEVPDGRIIACHPDDERRLRDAIACEQETPKWWRDWQLFERALRDAIGANP